MNFLRAFWQELTTAATGDGLAAGTTNNFTPHAQQVLALARKEADRYNHNFVGTEHLLLGLTALPEARGASVLVKLGLNLDALRLEIERLVGTGPDQKMAGLIPYTPRTKKVLELALKEAKALNHTHVGTEHILLGLLGEGDGVAARVLKNLGVDVARGRTEVLRELGAPDHLLTATNTVSSENENALIAQKQRGAVAVDISKRYDIYCSEGVQKTVVYRNALFKDRCKLLSMSEHEIRCDFFEIEQSNGQTVYVSSFSILKFCEPGSDIACDTLLPRTRE
jgi:hypothetical protein